VDQSVAAYSRAIELDPKNAAAYDNRGMSYRRLGLLDKAFADLTKAIILDPNAAEAHNILGAFLCDCKKDYERAVAEFRVAIGLRPTMSDAQFNLGNALYGQGKLDLAVAAYRKAIKLEPKNAKFHYSLGNAMLAQGHADRAATTYRKGIELEPKNALNYRGLAATLSRQGKVDQEAAAWRKATELEPKNALNYRGLADALWGQGKVGEAVTAGRKAVELEPNNAQALNNLAWRLATCPDPKVRDPRRAVEYAKQAVQVDPAGSMNTLGVAYYYAGHWRATIGALEKSVELDHGPATSFNAFFLAMAYRQLGKQEQARKWYDQGMEWMRKNAPNNEELRRFRAEAEQLLEIKDNHAKVGRSKPGH
jgi:superkiller protein 3